MIYSCDQLVNDNYPKQINESLQDIRSLCDQHVYRILVDDTCPNIYQLQPRAVNPETRSIENGSRLVRKILQRLRESPLKQSNVYNLDDISDLLINPDMHSELQQQATTTRETQIESMKNTPMFSVTQETVTLSTMVVFAGLSFVLLLALVWESIISIIEVATKPSSKR